MCGIAGVVRLGPGAPPATREQALAMAERLRHRGPDGRAAWASPSGRCALGHARLEVIDLATGDQPMANEDGSVQVVFNGEIYNFQRLRAELEAAGHRLRTRSDTEAIVHGYEEWGERLPEHLDGMFAFAVWDERRGRLLLARDRTGKKPLFWTRVGDRLVFASEIKAIFALAGVLNEIEPEAFPYYLAYGYVPAPMTFYRGVRVLPPASWMMATCAGGPAGGAATLSEPTRYWRLDWRADPTLSEAEAVTSVRELMGAAVERRLVADVPLGAFLSGGIDSTVIVGLMRERIEGRIRTFSLGFADDPTYDETAFARMAAEQFGTDHLEFTVEADSVELVDRLVAAHDQPFGDSSAIPTSIVSGLTREHVTVALTGDGGDEMFGGYPRFLGMAVGERMPHALSALGDAIGRRLPYHQNFRHPTRRFSRFFHAAALGPEERMLRWIGFFPDDVERMLRPTVPGVERRALLESFRRPWEAAAGQSSFTRALALNFESYLPEDLLVKADRSSMMHGLELRAPFLDTAVMEFAATLPDGLRHRGHRPGSLKRLLRLAFPDFLPSRLADRGKMGFGVPLPTWFRNQWKPLFEARVLAPAARMFEWLDREPVERYWMEHQSGSVDHGHKLWSLLTLESWLRGRGGS
jgi:asparagine synthase (glutamine-hydrolysing)